MSQYPKGEVGAMPKGARATAASAVEPETSPVSSEAGVTIADILALAAELLEPEGAWTQGAFSRNADGSIDTGGEDGDPDGAAEHPVCWCALGAIAQAAGRDLTVAGFPLTGPLHEASTTVREVVGVSVADWNDDPARTQEQVVTALRAAADLAKARGAA